MNQINTAENRQSDAKMISKTFFRLLPIQFLLIAIGSINAIVDSTMASRLIGAGALAAVGLFSPIVKITEVISGVLQGGSQILCGRFLGKHEVKRTGQIFSVDIAVSLTVSTLLMAVCLLFTDGIAKIVAGYAENYDELVMYIRGVVFALPAQIIGSQLSGFLQLEKQEKRTYTAIAVMAVLNISMNYLFISVFDMGIMGLGISTSISTWCFMLIQLHYYISGRSVIRLDLKDLVMSDLPKIVRIGAPGAVSLLCQAIRAVYLNAMLTKYSGSDGVGAYAAAMSFGYIFFAATGGIASSTRLLASVYIGEEDRTGLLFIMKTALYKGIGLVTGIAAVLFALAYPFSLFFSTDTASEFFSMTLMFFRAFPLSMPLSALCVIYITYYQSAERLTVVNILSVFDGILGIVISILLLAPFLGAVSIVVAQVTNGLFSVAIILIYTMLVNKKLPSSIEDTLVLPDDFGIPEDDRLDITIREMDEVVNASERLMEFCSRHGINQRQSYFSGLCVEEMAGNIVRYGFDDNKKHSIDVRIALNRKLNNIIIRLKDDCRPFDPKERAAFFESEDQFKNIGIRMTANISKSMEYNFILGLNVLTLTLDAS